MNQQKLCPKCSVIKNRCRDFYFSNGKKPRHSSFCKLCVKTVIASFQKRNKDKVNAQHRRLQKDRKEKIFTILGNSCKKCGFSDKRALQIDHKKGKGLKEIRQIRREGMFRKILENAKDYQILCANCNWIKRYKKNEGFKVII